MPTAQQAQRTPRQSRRQTTVEATLRVGRHSEEHSGSATAGGTTRSNRDEAWVDSLTPEQLLTECNKRGIELPSNGGNVITRRARLRKHVLEHGRAIKTKAEKPPVGGPPVKTATNTSSGPDAGQKQRTAKQPPPEPPQDKKRNKGKQPPPPPQGGKPDKKSPPPPPPARAQTQNPDAPRPRWFWPALAAIIALGIIGVLLVEATRSKGENTATSDIVNAFSTVQGKTTTTAGASPTNAGATPTQAAALTESQVKQIATDAANQAIKDANVLNASQAKQLVSDAVTQALLAFQSRTARTPDDVMKVASDYVQKQALQGQQPAGADWASNKCAWLRTNFPQDTKTIQSLGAKSAGVDSKRIRPTRFRCNATTNDGVFDGYVVMGPNEGFLGTFTVSVPDHGRVDSYATSCGARYTVDPRPIAVGSPNKCDDTWAIDSGSVTALSATVYAFNDENPPIGGSSAQPGGKSTTDNGQGQCMLGKDLASQRGWTLVQPQPSSVTQYGGAQVEVKTQDTVPQGWEATTNGPALHGGDLLTPGFYSVYPPHGACRVSLGVQD